MIAVNLLQMTVWFVGHCDHGQSRPGADGHRHRPALGSSRSDREGSPRFRINYWVKNKLSDRDIKRTDEVIEATKKSKGLLPKDVVRTGFSPAPTKDFIDGNYCDEGHSGPGLFDDPDDPDDPQHQNVNATISEPRPCHCRSYKHHISSCPSPGKHCTSTNCLSVYDENCPQLEYIFECLCHPIESPPSFNTIPEDDYHLKTTDPTYIIKLHNSLVPKIANMDRNEKYLMRKTKECKFHLNDSYSKKLERLHLKYFASLPEKILKSNSLKSEYKEINLSSSNNTDNQLKKKNKTLKNRVHFLKSISHFMKCL